MPPYGWLPFSEHTHKFLELTVREAIQLGHDYFSTQHMLLGLIEENGVAARLLVELGIVLDDLDRDLRRPGVTMRLRPEVLGLSSAGQGGPGGGNGAPLSVSVHGWEPGNRPSGWAVPAILPVGALLLPSNLVAMTIDRLEVYRNCFTIALTMRVDAHRAADALKMLRQLDFARWPEIGVRLTDGSTSRSGSGLRFVPDLANTRDESGSPKEWRAWAWVSPLPPDGPFEIVVALENAESSESSATLDGTAIRTAAEHSQEP
jgi:hypothetical protein